MAKVRLSFETWEDAKVASSTIELPIVEQKNDQEKAND